MANKLTRFAGGGLVYTPAMMLFDGNTYFEKTSYTTSGNKQTIVLRPLLVTSTGGSSKVIASVFGSSGNIRAVIRLVDSDNVNDPNKIFLLYQDSGGVNKGRIYAPANFTNGAPCTIFSEVDGDTGTAVLRINGTSYDEMVANRIAPATATLDSGASSILRVGSSGSVHMPSGFQCGYCGTDDSGGLDWQNFMTSDGSPKDIESVLSTVWGGTPDFWNAHGELDNNQGGAGNASRVGTGTIVIGNGGSGPHPLLGLNTVGTAVAADIATGKTAWVNGAQITGTA